MPIPPDVLEALLAQIRERRFREAQGGAFQSDPADLMPFMPSTEVLIQRAFPPGVENNLLQDTRTTQIDFGRPLPPPPPEDVGDEQPFKGPSDQAMAVWVNLGPNPTAGQVRDWQAMSGFPGVPSAARIQEFMARTGQKWPMASGRSTGPGGAGATRPTPGGAIASLEFKQIMARYLQSVIAGTPDYNALADLLDPKWDEEVIAMGGASTLKERMDLVDKLTAMAEAPGKRQREEAAGKEKEATRVRELEQSTKNAQRQFLIQQAMANPATFAAFARLGGLGGLGFEGFGGAGQGAQLPFEEEAANRLGFNIPKLTSLAPGQSNLFLGGTPGGMPGEDEPAPWVGQGGQPRLGAGQGGAPTNTRFRSPQLPAGLQSLLGGSFSRGTPTLGGMAALSPDAQQFIQAALGFQGIKPEQMGQQFALATPAIFRGGQGRLAAPARR